MEVKCLKLSGRKFSRGALKLLLWEQKDKTNQSRHCERECEDFYSVKFCSTGKYSFFLYWFLERFYILWLYCESVSIRSISAKIWDNDWTSNNDLKSANGGWILHFLYWIRESTCDEVHYSLEKKHFPDFVKPAKETRSYFIITEVKRFYWAADGLCMFVWEDCLIMFHIESNLFIEDATSMIK